MEQLQGKFVWHDLLTPDPAGARQFYGELFGWEFTAVADGRYHVIHAGTDTIGGMVDAGVVGFRPKRAYWLCGVSCEDVDATVQSIRDRGGKAERGPLDLPERGRIAIVRDAEGAPLQLIDSSSGDPADGPHQAGRWIWHELISNAPERAAGFYADILGYEVDAAKAGVAPGYRILETGGIPRAGIAENPFVDAPPVWIAYVLVDDLDAMVSRVRELGGTVAVEPRADVRDGTLALVLDPMGAPIALQHYEEGR